MHVHVHLIPRYAGDVDDAAGGVRFVIPEREAALSAVAAETSWPSHPADTLGVARSIHLRLPSHARLWVRKNEFSAVGTEPLDAVLA